MLPTNEPRRSDDGPYSEFIDWLWDPPLRISCALIGQSKPQARTGSECRRRITCREPRVTDCHPPVENLKGLSPPRVTLMACPCSHTEPNSIFCTIGSGSSATYFVMETEDKYAGISYNRPQRLHGTPPGTDSAVLNRHASL